MTTLRVPKAWDSSKNTLTARKADPKAVSAAVDMSAETVDKLLCPVTREPMKIVRINYRNADGTMDPSYAAVHPESRVCLPLSNEMLAHLEKNPPQAVQTLPNTRSQGVPTTDFEKTFAPSFQEWDKY